MWSLDTCNRVSLSTGVQGNCQVKTRKIQTKNNDEGPIDGREYSVQEFKSRLRTARVQHVNDFFGIKKVNCP
jgi:hypothetical protein